MLSYSYMGSSCSWESNIPPDHLLLDSAPNLGPLISCWEINKFEICWYKRVRILEVLKLLFQQFLNLSSFQRAMSGSILGDLSNNRWSGGGGEGGGWYQSTCIHEEMNRHRRTGDLSTARTTRLTFRDAETWLWRRLLYNFCFQINIRCSGRLQEFIYSGSPSAVQQRQDQRIYSVPTGIPAQQWRETNEPAAKRSAWLLSKSARRRERKAGGLFTIPSVCRSFRQSGVSATTRARGINQTDLSPVPRKSRSYMRRLFFPRRLVYFIWYPLVTLFTTGSSRWTYNFPTTKSKKNITPYLPLDRVNKYSPISPGSQPVSPRSQPVRKLLMQKCQDFRTSKAFVSAIFEVVKFPRRYQWSKIRDTVQ